MSQYTMEESVKRFEILLGKKEHELDDLLAKVDKEYKDLTITEGIVSKTLPAEFAGRIQDFRTELARISAEVAEFESQQREIMNGVQQHISQVSNQFVDLNNIKTLANNDKKAD